MQPYITVWFRGLANDLSIEAAVHRWVARLEATTLDIWKAEVAIERVGKQRVVVSVMLDLADGRQVATAAHDDVYVAVAEACRTVRKQWLASSGARRLPSISPGMVARSAA